MEHKIDQWQDIYGKITFHHGEEFWSVSDNVGKEGMVFQTTRLTVSVPMGLYPRPDFAEQVLNDFYRCNPGIYEGKWEWVNKRWIKAPAD